MPTPTRPSSTPAWTQGNGAQQIEPTSPEKFSGYSPNQRPSPKKLNWILGNVSDWIDWFDYKIQAGIAALQGYDWVVGIAGTHADINALMADSNVVPGQRILVTSPQTLIVTQTISKTDLQFDFKSSAVYSKGLTLATGILVSAARTTIQGGRMTDFSGGSDTAIRIGSGIKNSLIFGMRFANCTTGIDDLGDNSAISMNIEEV